MKKQLLITGLLLGSFFSVNAQLLQSEDFNSLTVGDVGTDITGATPGQGSWYTYSTNGTTAPTSTNAAASNFQIVAAGNNATKGLKIVSPDATTGSRFMFKAGFDAVWATRTTGNKFIEVEYDLFTGAATTSTAQVGVRVFGLDENAIPAASRVLNGFVYTMNTRTLSGVAYIKNGAIYNTYLITLGATPLVLTANTWYRIGFAYDTTTGETVWKAGTAYTGLPQANWAGPYQPIEVDFVSTGGTGNTLASELTMDNLTVKATATEALLGVNDNKTVAKFSVFPNPATTVINFSNNDNSIVNSIEMMDVNGRVVKSVKVNTPEGQISIDDLSAGIYMMKIISDQGSVTKKIVKQ